MTGKKIIEVHRVAPTHVSGSALVSQPLAPTNLVASDFSNIACLDENEIPTNIVAQAPERLEYRQMGRSVPGRVFYPCDIAA